MTAARGVAFGALAVAVVLVAVMLLRGGGGHTYSLEFQNAGQLVKGDDVQVGGRRIGSVKEIGLTNDNHARVKVTVNDSFGALHEGTRATIRQTSLSGIANRYVTLTPGPNSARKLADGSTLGTDSTVAPVDLDQLFNTLDPKTTKGLQNVIQGFATQYKGAGPQANKAAKYFNPTLSTTRHLVNEVVRDQSALSNLLTYGNRVTGALAAREGTLTNLVTNTDKAAGAIGSENQALSTSLQQFPQTLRRANTTFVDLRGALDDLDTLVAVSKPATKNLAPFFRALRPLVTDARPTIADLRKLIRRPGRGNDAIELLRKAPGLANLAKPAFDNTIKSLRRSTPTLQFIRPYTPDLVGWLRDFGQGASNYDANGHFARIQPIFNTFSFAENPAGGLLIPSDPSKRLAGLSTGNVKRCPGAASQPAPDNSSPFTDPGQNSDCDPRLVLPGP